MSDAETELIMESAADCAEGECSVDDVTDLVSELKEQKRVLQTRLDQIMNMISELQHLNEKDSRKSDDVRALVRDMLRVFSNDGGGPGFTPSGFSGDIGSTTAYDALPPKKWKPAEKK